jgi:uncharacterized protein (TIGR02611 family)
VHQALHRHPATGLATKLIVTGIGLLVLGAGLVMMVTPGPGIVGIVIGLAILATEWDWADDLLHRAREKLDEARAAAARVDPKVKRRRILIALVSMLVIVATGVVAIWVYGWPGPVVSGWDKLQSLADWVPDLPGM